MRARVLQTPRSRRTCSGAAPSATDETSGAGVRLPRSPVRSLCAPGDSHVCGGGSVSLMTSIMRRECGGGRLQAPRHLLEDLCSTNDARYAIESGRDFGSPPFSLDFGKSKRAGILVRIPRPAAVLITSWLPRRVSARPRRRKTSSRLGAPAAPFAATPRPARATRCSLSWGACREAFSRVQCAWLSCGGCCCQCRRWPTKKATSASSTLGCPRTRPDRTFIRGCATETPSLMSPSRVSVPSASGPPIPPRLSCAART
jgi:hypothetical protein